MVTCCLSKERNWMNNGYATRNMKNLYNWSKRFRLLYIWDSSALLLSYSIDQSINDQFRTLKCSKEANIAIFSSSRELISRKHPGNWNRQMQRAKVDENLTGCSCPIKWKDASQVSRFENTTQSSINEAAGVNDSIKKALK